MTTSTADGTRHRALAELMLRADLDAAVVSSYELVSYLAGTDIRSQLLLPARPAFYVQTRTGRRAVLVCDIEESQVRAQQPDLEVHSYVEFAEDPGNRLAEVIGALTPGREGDGLRIGADLSVLPAGVDRALRPATVVAADAELTGLASAKPAAEIDQVSALATGLLGCLDRALGQVGAGGTEADYSRALTGQIAAAGALPLFVFFASGPRTALGHPEADPAPMAAGAIWRTDFGARTAGGMTGDVARTGVVGEASPVQREVFAALRAAQDEVVAAAEVGRPAGDLFRVCRESFRRNGLPFRMPHVGHGIGLGVHEAPLLEPANRTPLAAGTALMIEPFAILTDRAEGYHTEDLMVVTEEGPRRLTVPQDELLVIG